MAEEKIIWKTCKSCNFLQHVDHIRCLNCNHEDFQEIEGKEPLELMTYTILSAPPKEFLGQQPYALGIARFENGVKVLAQLTRRENIYIGMKLKLEKTKLCDDLDGREVIGLKLAPV